MWMYRQMSIQQRKLEYFSHVMRGERYYLLQQIVQNKKRERDREEEKESMAEILVVWLHIH